MQIIIDGLLTRYDSYGDSSLPVVVLLHGWGDASIGWQQFARGLSDNYYIVVPNLPGFGGSEAPKTAWGLEEYAHFVARFIDKLGMRPAVLIGHSNGGAIAIHGLASGILHAGRLVLLASAGIRTTATGRKTLLRLVAKTGKIATWLLPQRLKQRLRKRLYTAVGSDLLVAEHMQATFKRIIREDVQQDAARLSLPTLLIYGQTDTATPPLFGQQLHQLIKDSTLKIIPAGHFVHQDAPEETIRLVRSFLQ